MSAFVEITTNPPIQTTGNKWKCIRDKVGILDLPGFSRYEVSGNDSDKFLNKLIAGDLPRVGRINLAYFSDKRGRILTEMSIIRHAEKSFTLISAAAAQWHDLELLENSISPDEQVKIRDVSDKISTFIVTGPNSRTLLNEIVEADLSLGWLTHQKAKILGTEIMGTCILCWRIRM